MLLGYFALIWVEGDRQVRLPAQFRITVASLSDLPVVVTDVRSCGCMSGPRKQAQRKFKFEVTNGSNETVVLDGGERSSIRLLVAYASEALPQKFTPPDPASGVDQVITGSPEGKALNLAEGFREEVPSQLTNSNRLFVVPDSWSLWALPPNPNKTVEILSGTPSENEDEEVAQEHTQPTAKRKS